MDGCSNTGKTAPSEPISEPIELSVSDLKDILAGLDVTDATLTFYGAKRKTALRRSARALFQLQMRKNCASWRLGETKSVSKPFVLLFVRASAKRTGTRAVFFEKAVSQIAHYCKFITKLKPPHDTLSKNRTKLHALE